MPETVVDVGALYAALDAKRQAERRSWRDVAGHLGVSPSAFTRMAQGHRPDVDTFATVVRWLGVPADAFMRPSRPPAAPDQPEQAPAPQPLAMVSTFLRSSPHIRPEEAE